MELFTSLQGIGALLLLALSPWVLLALFSALADTCVGFIDEWLLTKVESGDSQADAPGRLVLLSGFFGFVVCAGAAVVLGVHTQYSLQIPAVSLYFALLAGIIEVLWLIPYFYALERAGAVTATPLLQAIPVFALIFGLLFFSEVPSAIHILATALIIGGAILLNYSNKLKIIDKKTILLMFLASALISVSLFFFKESESTGNFVASVFGNGLGMGIASTFIWLLWKPYRTQFNQFLKSFNKKVLFGQFANETLYGAGALAGQLAIVLGPSVMIVTAFNAFHPLFTLSGGWLLAKQGSKTHQEIFKKRERTPKIFGVLLIALGAALVVF